MLACCLAAGLDGIRRDLTPPPATDRNLFGLSGEQAEKLGIEALPLDLKTAVEELKKDRLLAGVLGEHALRNFLLAKESEWTDYTRTVTDWEIRNYLQKY